MQAIIQYKTDQIDVMLTPIQFRIIEILKKYPEGVVRGLNNERGSLMKKLNRARTTIFDNLVKLEKLGLVEKTSKNNGRMGRPKEFWKIKNNEKNQ